MEKLTPFRIEVPQDTLDDLQVRLKNTRWTDEPKNADWKYGTNPSYLKELADYWQNQFDWRKQEETLNQLPQFTTSIAGTTIHLVYAKGKGNAPKPLLLTHGWPDSFFRFSKVIPMLTDPANHGGQADESFDVIVPSIPGFGFSDRTAMSTDQVAVIWNKLMTEALGYSTYYAAGGDLGSIISKSLANQFPKQVKAIHITDVGYPNGSEDWSKMSPAEQEFGQFIQNWVMTEGAYGMIQSTKPQTLGYGLNDSPLGLASWIVEKFYGWSDTHGDLDNSFTKDELLTNIMIYWVSQTINSAARAYYEEGKAMQSGGLKSSQRVEAPTGVALFPTDAQFPKEWAERMANVKQFNKMPKGGHFAALETPDLFVGELRSFFRQY